MRRIHEPAGVLFIFLLTGFPRPGGFTPVHGGSPDHDDPDIQEPNERPLSADQNAHRISPVANWSI